MGASTVRQSSPTLPVKTLRKQALEVLGAYQYVLTFIFMGERTGWGMAAGNQGKRDPRADG